MSWRRYRCPPLDSRRCAPSPRPACAHPNSGLRSPTVAGRDGPACASLKTLSTEREAAPPRPPTPLPGEPGRRAGAVGRRARGQSGSLRHWRSGPIAGLGREEIFHAGVPRTSCSPACRLQQRPLMWPAPVRKRVHGQALPAGPKPPSLSSSAPHARQAPYSGRLFSRANSGRGFRKGHTRATRRP